MTSGADDREEKTVAVSLAGSGIVVGRFDLRFAHALEPFQIHLSAEVWAAAGREGVRLRLEHGDKPWWILAPGLTERAAVLSPHLLPEQPITADDRRAAFFDRVASLAVLQPFGWMEGCVLDGLYDLDRATKHPRWAAALEAHLAVFGLTTGQLVYEDPSGRPADGRIYGIEGTLPFAVLAKCAPQSPLLDLALEFWRQHLTADAAICDGDQLTAEGSYTVAYPLAVLAEARRDAELGTLALTQLRLRRQALHQSDGIWLRCSPPDQRTFSWWARGVAWYLLGLVRSLEHLAWLGEAADLQIELRQVADRVSCLQHDDGLWGCFLDDPRSPADPSGSAGIAAALARAANHGWLAPTATVVAQRTWQGLRTHLTADGFLGHAAQSNRGGEALQRSSYRVMSPLAMGLMGQLAAALGIAAER